MVSRIAIVSNTDQQCGNAADARDIQRELLKYYEYVWIGHPLEIPYPVDVVIINWHPARVTLDAQLVRGIQARGAKVIVIHQNSNSDPLQVQDGDALFYADAVVAHEPMESNRKIEFIPIGIPVVDDLPEPSEDFSIGTAGFPFDWKRYDVVAEAARRFNARCVMIAPKSDQHNTDEFMDGVAGHLGGLAEIYRGWMQMEDVVRKLATCTLNIFWYESRCFDDQLGQSGSVRMGIAAKRPMIISTHRKLRMLQGWTDDLYIAEKEEDVYRLIEQIKKQGRDANRPTQLVAEQNWSVLGLMYKNMIERVCNGIH